MSIDLTKISLTERRRLIETAKAYQRQTGYPIVHMPFNDCGAEIVTVNLMTAPPHLSNYEQNPCLKDFS